MGAPLFGLPSPPLGVLCWASAGQGGPSGRLLQMCTPRSAMRWPAAVLFWLYPFGGPHVPVPESIPVRRATLCRGIENPASQRGALPAGYGDGDCAVDGRSPRILLFLPTVRQAGRPRVHGVARAILHSFLGVPGLQVVRSAYWPGALHATWAPSGPLRVHQGGLASVTSHGSGP